MTDSNVNFRALYVDAYIIWQETIEEEGLDAGVPIVSEELLQGVLAIRVIDVFCKCSNSFLSRQLIIMAIATYHLDAQLAVGDQGVTATLV